MFDIFIYFPAQVDRLKAEMQEATDEVQYKEEGVKTLECVDRKLSNARRKEDVKDILDEFLNIQKNLAFKEQEKADLQLKVQALLDMVDKQTPPPPFPSQVRLNARSNIAALNYGCGQCIFRCASESYAIACACLGNA